MNVNELKNDANFYLESIGDVLLYMAKTADSTNRYVSRISMFGDEPVIRMWAYRRKKNMELEYTEVERKSLHCEWAVRKNVYFVACGGGYHPVYKPKNIESRSTYYGYLYERFSESDFDRWMTEKPMFPSFNHLLNPEKIFQYDKWKYCGWTSQYDLFDYLLKYEKEPLVEYFGKNGIPTYSTLIRKAKKDRQFAKYLVDNAADVRDNGSQATIYAYDNHVTMDEAWYFLEHKRNAYKATSDLADINKYKNIRIKVYEYMTSAEEKSNKGCWKSSWGRSASYRDYWNACVNLGLDMNDTKNYAPKDFQRMHDLRIDEWASRKVELEKEKKKKLDAELKAAAELYMNLPGIDFDDKYVVIIPKCKKDFVAEGNALHHCVGKMGYDVKMQEGKCLIGFVRLKEDIDKPYVTVEYLTEQKKIAQCYADHDSRPPQEVKDFADKWAEIITKELKKNGKDGHIHENGNHRQVVA